MKVFDNLYKLKFIFIAVGFSQRIKMDEWIGFSQKYIYTFG